MDVHRKRHIMIAASGLMLLIAAFLIFRPDGENASGQGLNQPMTLKCIDPQCGAVKQTTLEWASKNWHGGEDWMVTPGAPCPKCNRNTLATVVTCPKDGTVFFEERVHANVLAAKGTDAYKAIAAQPSGKCPACGWTHSAGEVSGARP